MIRNASHDDIPRIVAIRATVRENRLSDPSKVTPTDIEWFVNHGPIHVWQDADGVQGFAAGDPRDGSIWALFVDPAREGQGIGQALISAACASLRQAGHPVATLRTDAGTRAERFYLRNGWTAQGVNARGEMVLTKSI
ncbi:MAG: GNAT family N-acetyltransferase [Micropepsaceae bacterium]